MNIMLDPNKLCLQSKTLSSLLTRQQYIRKHWIPKKLSISWDGQTYKEQNNEAEIKTVYFNSISFKVSLNSRPERDKQ